MIYVCEWCLAAIQAHEGRQFARRLSWDNVDEKKIEINTETSAECCKCEWCGILLPIDELYEI